MTAAPLTGGTRAPRSFAVTVEGVADEAEGIASITFSAPPDFAYEAGQHVTLRAPGLDDPKGPQRTFTLSSSPTEMPRLMITTRRGRSPFKHRLLSAAPGEAFGITGPFGRFTLDPSREALLLAGGIGITPFRSMLRWAADTHRSPHVRLLHSVARSTEIPFRAEFEEIARVMPTFRCEYTLTGNAADEVAGSGRKGRIGAPWILEALQEMDRPRVYLCGPPAMVVGLKEVLITEVGVSPADLRIESFSGY